MRVLQINKFFYRRGGAEVVFFDTINGLRQRGHEVIEFSSSDKRNSESDFENYFIENLGELSGEYGPAKSLQIFGKLFHSPEAVNNLRALIMATEPEVAHLHNIYHHMPPAVFRILKKSGIPIVLTVHDVQPMCPNHRMMRGVDNKLCESCFQHKYFNSVRYRCINNSLAASAAGALESYFYWLSGIWNLVDRFICPSEFMLNKMLSWGFPKEKLRLLRNPFDVPQECPPLGDKILYIGRFHVEKGIKILMQSLPWLRQYQTIIAGAGPEEKWVRNFITQYSLTNAKMIGWLDKAKLETIIREAKVVVVPSVFYENCSLSVLEALSYGRIVVASDRGGNSESRR